MQRFSMSLILGIFTDHVDNTDPLEIVQKHSRSLRSCGLAESPVLVQQQQHYCV